MPAEAAWVRSILSVIPDVGYPMPIILHVPLMKRFK